MQPCSVLSSQQIHVAVHNIRYVQLVIILRSHCCILQTFITINWGVEHLFEFTRTWLLSCSNILSEPLQNLVDLLVNPIQTIWVFHPYLKSSLVCHIFSMTSPKKTKTSEPQNPDTLQTKNTTIQGELYRNFWLFKACFYFVNFLNEKILKITANLNLN